MKSFCNLWQSLSTQEHGNSVSATVVGDPLTNLHCIISKEIMQLHFTGITKHAKKGTAVNLMNLNLTTA